MKQVLLVLLIIGVLGGVYYISTKGPTIKPDQSVKIESSSSLSTSSSSESTADAMVKTVEIEAGSFYYKPSTIEITKGQKVKIVMKSVSMMHDFVIDELGVKMPIVKNGDTGSVEFTADKVGTFEYYCSVGQHRANGQVGSLIVK